MITQDEFIVELKIARWNISWTGLGWLYVYDGSECLGHDREEYNLKIRKCYEELKNGLEVCLLSEHKILRDYAKSKIYSQPICR